MADKPVSKEPSQKDKDRSQEVSSGNRMYRVSCGKSNPYEIIAASRSEAVEHFRHSATDFKDVPDSDIDVSPA